MASKFFLTAMVLDQLSSLSSRKNTKPLTTSDLKAAQIFWPTSFYRSDEILHPFGRVLKLPNPSGSAWLVLAYDS